jgi:hypothetical protein
MARFHPGLRHGLAVREPFVLLRGWAPSEHVAVQFVPLRPPKEVRGRIGAWDRVAACVEEDIRRGDESRRGRCGPVTVGQCGRVRAGCDPRALVVDRPLKGAQLNHGRETRRSAFLSGNSAAFRELKKRVSIGERKAPIVSGDQAALNSEIEELVVDTTVAQKRTGREDLLRADLGRRCLEPACSRAEARHATGGVPPVCGGARDAPEPCCGRERDPCCVVPRPHDVPSNVSYAWTRRNLPCRLATDSQRGGHEHSDRVVRSFWWRVNAARRGGNLRSTKVSVGPTLDRCEQDGGRSAPNDANLIVDCDEERHEYRRRQTVVRPTRRRN